MGGTLFAYASTWTWSGPVDGVWNTAANWTIAGAGSGAPTYNELAVISNTTAIVTGSNAFGGSVYVRAATTGTANGFAPALNFTGDCQFNNGVASVGSGGNNYGGVASQTNGFLWGNYNGNGPNNMNLYIASQGSGFTNAVGTFSLGGTSLSTEPAFLGGTAGTVSIGTSAGERGTLLLHDYGIFSTYGIKSSGTASRTSTGGSITVAGNGANGGIGTVSVTGSNLSITTGTLVLGGIGSTSGTATLVSTLDATGISTITAANSISLGTHAAFNLRLSGTDFSATVNQVFTPLSTSGAITGTFSGIQEGYYLTTGGYTFKASYLNNKFTLTAAELPFSNPAYSGTCVVITQPGVYDGYCWTSGTSTTPAVIIATTGQVTIQNCLITGQGDLIANSGTAGAWGANVVVKNCTGYGYNTNIPNNGYKGCFVNIAGFGSLDVENCFVEGCRMGVHVNGYTGPGTITVRYNQFKNIDGRFSDGAGGYQTSGQVTSHAIQIAGNGGGGPLGVSGMEVSWNEIINMPWLGAQDDMINVYDASGNSISPVLIHDNYIYGVWPTDPSAGTSGGVGINTDGGTTDTAATTTAFVNVYNNQVVAAGNGALAASAGHDNTFYNNRAISSGKLPNGNWLFDANVGLIGYNPYGQSGSVFFNNLMRNNLVGWVGKVSGSYIRNDWYCPSITLNNITQWPSGGPTLQDEADEYLQWVQKLQANGISVGPAAEITAADNSLLMWYPFDQSSGASVALDASGYGNNGTLLGMNTGTSWVSGIVGSGALSFSGTGDCVETTAPITTPTEYTLACWAKNSSGNVWSGFCGAFFCQDQRSSFIFTTTQGSTQIVMIVYHNTGSRDWAGYVPPAGFNVSQWHHYATTVSGQNKLICLYIDGALVLSQTMVADPLNVVTAKVFVGHDTYLTNYSLSGQMDDTRMYSRVLSQSEIQALSTMH